MIILLYHRILRDIREDSYFPHGVVPLAEFEVQINFLRRAFDIVSLEEGLRTIREKRKSTKRLISLTFDDGWRDVWKYGVPILRTRRIPATFFLTTCFLDKGGIPWWEKLYSLAHKPQARGWVLALRRGLHTGKLQVNDFWDLFQKMKTISPSIRDEILDQRFEATFQEVGSTNDRLFMNWEEAGDLAKIPFFTVGAHGVRHECLSALSRTEILREEGDSKKILVEKLKRPVNYFAYPFGLQRDLNQEAIRGCRSLGFHAALTAEADVNSPRTSLFRLKRIPVGLNLRGKLFQAVLQYPEVFLSWTRGFRWP